MENADERRLYIEREINQSIKFAGAPVNFTGVVQVT